MRHRIAYDLSYVAAAVAAEEEQQKQNRSAVVTTTTVLVIAVQWAMWYNGLYHASKGR